jgi:iron complex outermembrane receptor protein
MIEQISNRLRRSYRALTTVLLFLAAPPGHAALLKLYAVEAQPLSDALLAFAQQAKLQILFKVQSLPDIEAKPLYGSYSVEQAIEKLLRGTGLSYQLGANGALVITRPPLEPNTENPIPSQGAAPTFAGKRIEEFIVTGIRGSLRQNLAIKRAAGSVTNVITAEDIGKFPDKNVADSLQRMPGISVDRIWGEGRDVNIRGTDKDINRTLMNGQNVASAYWWANDNPSRGFNYSILASELVSSLEVYKSPEADIDEGSIGGTVIVRTRRPLELPSDRFHFTLQQQYSELPDQWDPQVSALYSWKNTEATFGVLAAYNYQSRHLRRDGLEAFPDGQLYSLSDPQGNIEDNVHVPWGMGSAIFQQERVRRTSNLTVQWRPNDHWEWTLNAVQSSMDMDNSNQNYLAVPGGFKLNQQPPAFVSDATILESADGTRSLMAATLENPNTPGAALDAIFRDAFIHTTVVDLDWRYQSNDWSLHGQFGLTRAKGGTDRTRLYRFQGDTRIHYDLASDQVEFQFPDLDPLDATALDQLSSETHEWVRQMDDEEEYVQLDLEKTFDHRWFPSLKMGVKWRDHVIENRRLAGDIDTTHPDWATVRQIGLDEVHRSLSPRLHDESASPGSLRQYAWVDGDLAAQRFDPIFDSSLVVFKNDRNAFYRINEEISAFYVKLNVEHDRWRGNIGLRYVSTEQSSHAFQQEQIVQHHRRYDDWLPSLNIVYEASDTLLFRGGLSRVMARPTFPHLTPSIIIDATDGTASGGNPDLNPFRADQMDIGFEWYFADSAILAMTWFYKDMSTFIFTRRQPEWIDGEWLQVTRPLNAPGADIQGVEVEWQQDLGLGFGVVANYTYTDAKVPSHPGTDSLGLPGNSRDQVNAGVYYEAEPVSLRLSYNYRSDSFGGFSGGTQDVTEAYGQWDFSASVNLTQHLSVVFEGVNLFNEIVYFHTAHGVPQGIYENGRRFLVGIRVSY